LSHVILCTGETAHDVYSTLYSNLREHGIGNGYIRYTFVFPSFLRKVIRERFGSKGLYDEQYLHRNDVYNVTVVDLIEAEWPMPPDDCDFCMIPMPDTP
jgi:hypothetical protein